ncbi:MAG TPA: hypothetical protein VMF62_17060 [Acetobacteraceae bacterium]|nr:hypothetical protein [Acetobacteraceae bacterium]
MQESRYSLRSRPGNVVVNAGAAPMTAGPKGALVTRRLTWVRAILVKLAGCNLLEIKERLDLAAAAASLVAGCAEISEVLARLEGSGYLMEAARLLAHALPNREATWWACMCTRHTAPPDLPAPEQAARAAAEQWVREQTDEARRVALAAARQAGFGSPEAWAGVAAFWSGQSAAPLAHPPLPPAEHLAGTAVSGAVALASVRSRPERQKDRLARFLESGHNIAAGGPGRLTPEEG